MPADRPPPMSLSEAETIWMSKSAMKKPTHIVANAMILVTVGRSAGEVPAAGARPAAAALIGRLRRRPADRRSR